MWILASDYNSINLAIVSANNHYAGFGPGTANIFRKMLVGLQEAQFPKNKESKNEEVPPRVLSLKEQDYSRSHPQRPASIKDNDIGLVIRRIAKTNNNRTKTDSTITNNIIFLNTSYPIPYCLLLSPFFTVVRNSKPFTELPDF